MAAAAIVWDMVDEERRKTWIYEVPLRNVHQLRDSLVRFLPDDAPPLDLLARFDAPVLASTVKLWLLELNPPLGTWEGWEDIRTIYPNVGAGAPENAADHTEELKRVLGHLPKVYLQTLDAIMKHLKSLVDNTKVEEADDVYKTKLALSLGRAILRPKYENELSIQDRHPTLFFMDMLDHYADVLPPTIAKKQRESGIRAMPVRKRTAPVDQRLSRSSLTGNEDIQNLLKAQMGLRNPRSRNASPARGDAPPLPPAAEDLGKHPEDEAHAVPEEPTTATELEHEPVHEETHEELHRPAPTVTIEIERPTPIPSPVPPATELTEEHPNFPDDEPIEATNGATPAPVVSALNNEDEPISRSTSTLTRNSSAEQARRGVRARGPRATPSGGRSRVASDQVASSEVAHPHGPVDASEYAPRKKGGRGAAGLFAKRDGRAGLSGDEGEEESA